MGERQIESDEMKINECIKGLNVITPMNRPAIIIKVANGSNFDPFTRIILQYTDVKDTNCVNANLVSLQPHLLRIA
jgi:hypothetical protein